MAARKLPVADAPLRDLPLPTNERCAVRASGTLLKSVGAAVERSTEMLAAAEAALAAHRTTAADGLLQAIEEGKEPPVEDAELTAAVAAAHGRLDQARGAQRLATERYEQALAEARAELSAEVRPRIAELMAEAVVAARAAVEINDWLRAIVQFAAEQGAAVPGAAWEVALRLPDVRALDEQIEARRRLLNPEPAKLPRGYVLIRWLVDCMPYVAGETAGLSRDEAQLQCRAGLCEPVDPGQAKELGLDKLVRLDKPTRVKLLKPFTPRVGATIQAGTVHTFEPDLAARLVNLQFGEVV